MLAILLAACAAAPPRGRAVRADPPPSMLIYVIKRGWHIDIGFAAADLRPPLASVRAAFPTTRYLFFGFGDRRYLLARNQRFSNLLAALWRGPGLVLATSLQNTPQQAVGAGNAIAIAVTATQDEALQAFVRQTLYARDGSVTPLAEGPYPGSRFYAATQDYSALHTCNTWAAQALAAAGLPIHSGGIEFAGQLWRQLHQLCGHRLICRVDWSRPSTP